MFAAASHLVLAAVVLAWAGTVVAVARDVRERLENRAGRRAGAGIAALLPFVGGLVWLCVRPAETRVERRERRLRAAVLERQLLPPVLAQPVQPAAEQTPAQAA